MTRTGNDDFAYDNSGNTLLEFFSKAGSLFKNKGTYYCNESTVMELFKPAWITNNHKSVQLAMWTRDIRGGAGNRSGFRDIIKWLAKDDDGQKWIEANLHWIPEVGRWDDLEALIDTPCEKSALDFWVRAIQDGHQLAAKWAPRGDKNKVVFNKLRKVAQMDPKTFRKLLVKNTNVVETAMCGNNWYKIDYSKIPSVAMARYNNAFGKHDSVRFSQWKEALKKGVDEEGNEVKVNAGALFPHDVIRTLYADLDNKNGGHYGFTNTRRNANIQFKNSELANAQFEALPDYMDNNKMRIISICDFSGSMTSVISGSIRAIDVSMGLGLYCSDRLGKKNPFYRKFIPFSDDSRLVDWKNESFSIAAQKYNDGFVGSTNIRAALDQILNAAKLFGATNRNIPNCLIIISDMQFNRGTDNDITSVEAGLLEWEKAGYKRPKIVYWDLAGCQGSPSTKNHEDVGLVSGFSPSLLTAVLGGKDFSPMAILERAIEKYKITDPCRTRR